MEMCVRQGEALWPLPLCDLEQVTFFNFSFYKLRILTVFTHHIIVGMLILPILAEAKILPHSVFNSDYGNIITSHNIPFSSIRVRGSWLSWGWAMPALGSHCQKCWRTAAQVWGLTLESRVRSPLTRTSNVRALLSASRAFSSAEIQKNPW